MKPTPQKIIPPCAPFRPLCRSPLLARRQNPSSFSLGPVSCVFLTRVLSPPPAGRFCLRCDPALALQSVCRPGPCGLAGCRVALQNPLPAGGVAPAAFPMTLRCVRPALGGPPEPGALPARCGAVLRPQTPSSETPRVTAGTELKRSPPSAPWSTPRVGNGHRSPDTACAPAALQASRGQTALRSGTCRPGAAAAARGRRVRERSSRTSRHAPLSPASQPPGSAGRGLVRCSSCSVGPRFQCEETCDLVGRWLSL